MTREEAILCLKGIKQYGRDTFTRQSQGDWEESLDMAIKALEQEPCDKCEVGNPCLYCKHEFEPRESEVEE